MTPTSDPTDRSMLRETMTSTIPVAMIAMPAAWTASVIMLFGWISLPPLETWKTSRITAEGDHHAEQAEVDLGLGEHAADRRTRGRLDLPGNGCRVGHVRHDGPPGLVLETTCAPGRTRGRRCDG